MTIDQLVEGKNPLYFYIILFLFSMIEGESVVLTAGVLAFKGFLSFPKILIISFTATLIADQTLFYVGRAYGHRLLKKYPKLEAKSHRVFELLHRYNTGFILSFRFVYGIRTASPLVIGAAGISPKRYAILNFIAAVIWSVLSCSAGYLIGYFFADAIDAAIGKAIRYQGFFVGGVILLLCGFGLYKYFKKSKKPPTP